MIDHQNLSSHLKNQHFFDFLNEHTALNSKKIVSQICKNEISKLRNDGDILSYIDSKQKKYNYQDIKNLISNYCLENNIELNKEKTKIEELTALKDCVTRIQVGCIANKYDIVHSKGMTFNNDGDLFITLNHQGYSDKWIGKDNIYDKLEYYAQKSSTGDDLKIKVNDKLIQTNTSGKNIYVFEKILKENDKYLYCGKYNLSDVLKINNQIVFVMAKFNDYHEFLNSQDKILNTIIKDNKKDDKWIEQKAIEASTHNKKNATRITTITTQQVNYVRNAYIRNHIINLANNNCCDCHKTIGKNIFNDIPLLEVHHIVPLSEGGKDIIENCVAVCPNCHAYNHLK